MFEAVAALSIIFLAILFVASFIGPPSFKVVSSSSQLKVFGDDALRSLDQYNSDGKSIYHNSLLVEYIVTNDTDSFTSFLNQTLPETALYNVYVYSSLTHKTDLWYPSEPIPSVGCVVKSSRVFVYEGFVYEVQLEVWYL